MSETPTAFPTFGSPMLAGEAAAWRTAAQLFSSHDGHAVVQGIVETAHALTRADAALLLLTDGATGEFVAVVPGVAVGLDQRWLEGQGLQGALQTARQAATARQVVVHSLAHDRPAPSALDYPLLTGGRRAAGVCAAPLEDRGQLVGVLQLYTANAALAWDTITVASFAALGAIAIANAAPRQEQGVRERLEALDEATRTLAAELSSERVLQRIVEIAARISGARYGALGVVGADGFLSDFITTGLSTEERERIGALPRGHGLLGVLIRLGQPLRVPAIQRDPRRIGFPPHHPPMTSLLGVPIRVHNQVVGDLYLTDKIGAPEFSDEDQHLVELLTAHAGVAIENARLYAQVRELTMANERERIGRDLHDGIIQDLYATSLQLEDVAADLPDEASRQRLLGLADTLSVVIGDVRTYIYGLRARRLEGRALADGIAALARDLREQHGLITSYEVEGAPYPAPDALANTLLHIAREALSNVARHARASHAAIRLVYQPRGVSLSIVDDGVGFDPSADPDQEHRGLRNLRARAQEAGGTLTMRSAAGAGTTIIATAPTGPP